MLVVRGVECREMDTRRLEGRRRGLLVGLLVVIQEIGYRHVLSIHIEAGTKRLRYGV